MKKKHLFTALAAAVMLGFAACDNEPDINGPIINPPKPVKTDTLTVAQAIDKQDNSQTFVKGYIVGWFNNKPNPGVCEFGNEATDTTVNKANILIADSKDVKSKDKVACVQLPAGAVRTALNLGDNPGNLGKEVILYGTLTKYNLLPGVKETSWARIDGKEAGTLPSTGELKSITIPELNAKMTTSKTPAGNYKVKGIVTTNVANNNYTRGTLMIQTEGATAERNGIMIYMYVSATDKDFAEDYAYGEEIEVDLSKAHLQAYGKGNATCNEIIIEKADCIKKTGRKVATIAPVTITPDKLEAYQGMIVQIENVKAVTEFETWATGTTQFSNGTAEFPVYFNDRADFILGKKHTNATATIKGMAYVYGGGGLAQLVPGSLEDVEAFVDTKTPTVSIAKDAEIFYADGGTKTVAINSNLAGNQLFAKSDQADITATINADGDLEINAAERTVAGELKATVTVYLATAENGEPAASATMTVTQYGTDVEVPVYDSNLGFPTSDNKDAAYYKAKVIIDDSEYAGQLKLGTSSKTGSYSATVPANAADATTLSFYALAWKGKSGALKVSIEGDGLIDGATSKELTLTGNDGATSNSPFTITSIDEATQRFTLPVSGLNADTKIKFETINNGDPRAVIFGANLK